MYDFGPPIEELKINWEFEGAFSLVFKESDATRKLLAPGLKELGFRIHSIGYECDIASCANARIVGVHSRHRDGIQVGQFFASYGYIDRVVTANAVTLWSSK